MCECVVITFISYGSTLFVIMHILCYRWRWRVFGGILWAVSGTQS